MDDINILEAVERYLSGQMSPEELIHFEQLRKSNPEIDLAVVEHSIFLQQLHQYEDTRQFKDNLDETHLRLTESGDIPAPHYSGQAKVRRLFHRYKRVAAIAAAIGGIMILGLLFTLVWSAPGKPADKQDIVNLSRDIQTIDQKVNQIQRKSDELDQKLNDVKDQTSTMIEFKSGGTGFLVDSKGFIVTNAHVVNDARHIAVQSANGIELTAKVIYKDRLRDIAIIQIRDKDYKSPGPIPYSIKNTNSDLAEPIFTLGFPRNDIVYGDGYIASKTGYNGDTLTCQITIPANRGNSGSPILNRQGEVIGILSKKENTLEGVAFAIQSKYIFEALASLQKDSTQFGIKVPSSSNLKGKERMQQVKKITDYIFIVKVD